jgi:hypothetical protein
MKHIKPLPVPARVLCALALCLLLPGCEQPAGLLSGDIPFEEAPPAPGKPELLVEDGALGALWHTVLIAESYGVYYGTTTRAADAVKWTGPVTTDAETASAFITGLENGKRYYVWVSAANSAGESAKSEYAYAKPEGLSSGASRIFFDYGWMIPNYPESVERFYTVPQGKSLVLTPVLWKIGENPAYTWKVGGVEQQSGLSGQGNRYFTFTPGSTGTYTVEVTVEDGGTEYTAAANVVCTASYTLRSKTESSSAKALNAFGFMPGPGQFVGVYPHAVFNDSATPDSITSKVQQVVTNTGAGWFASLGSFGGYVVTGFDHSVPNLGTGRYELSIQGNAFGSWGEPGVVWVSRDDNGNGQPDDTWYELKGCRHNTGDDKRYAVTWYKPPGSGQSGIWRDNLGNTGTYARGFPRLQNLNHVILTGTRITASSVIDGGPWGYVDIVDMGRFSISNAVQVDGTPANLEYIDFVKVQNASHETAGVFGEISCETGVPFDLSIPNPALRIQGALVSGGPNNGMYSYTFAANESGYDMFISLDGGEFFELPRVSRGGAAITKYNAGQWVYFDYYGGNVLHNNSTPGIITFSAR